MRPRHDSHAENKNISPRAPSFSLRRAEILRRGPTHEPCICLRVCQVNEGRGIWHTVFYCILLLHVDHHGTVRVLLAVASRKFAFATMRESPLNNAPEKLAVKVWTPTYAAAARITGIFNEIRYIRRYITHTFERNPCGRVYTKSRIAACTARYTRVLRSQRPLCHSRIPTWVIHSVPPDVGSCARSKQSAQHARNRSTNRDHADSEKEPGIKRERERGCLLNSFA